MIALIESHTKPDIIAILRHNHHIMIWSNLIIPTYYGVSLTTQVLNQKPGPTMYLSLCLTSKLAPTPTEAKDSTHFYYLGCTNKFTIKSVLIFTLGHNFSWQSSPLPSTFHFPHIPPTQPSRLFSLHEQFLTAENISHCWIKKSPATKLTPR